MTSLINANGYLGVIITVAAIVLGALVLHLVISRAIARLARRLISSSRRRHERDCKTNTHACGSLDDDELSGVGPRGVSSEQERRTEQRIRTMSALLRYAAAVTILAVAGIMVLGELGVNIGPLLAGAGVAGIAIGFGAQALVRDYLTGIFMLTEDQYGVGDIVDVGEASGVVERVTLRLTIIRDVEGTLWYVPNGDIRRVGNKSYQWARALLDIGVAYDTDLGQASALIKEAADALWCEARPEAMIIEEPEIWGVEELGAHAVVIRLAVKTMPGQQWAVRRILRGRVRDAFDSAGIVIPFPQQTLWFHDASQTHKEGEAKLR
jgi:small conductance mechanosensitive channel